LRTGKERIPQKVLNVKLKGELPRGRWNNKLRKVAHGRKVEHGGN
jgi:hypothetical protein